MRDEDKSKDQLIRELRELRQKAADFPGEEGIEQLVGEELLQELVRVSGGESCGISWRVLSVQEEERKRIAKELHDSLGSLLTAVRISLESARALIGMDVSDPEFLDNSIHLTQLAIQEVRSLVSDLRPSLLDDLGLIAAMNWLCGQVAGCSKISIERRIEVDDCEVPEELKIVIFRILQEAFNNIVKYSQTTLVELSFTSDEKNLELMLKDHGVGFDVDYVLAANPREHGLGLYIMKERTECSGGSFSIVSRRDEGTTIRASWPKQRGPERSGKNDLSAVRCLGKKLH